MISTNSILRPDGPPSIYLLIFTPKNIIRSKIGTIERLTSLALALKEEFAVENEEDDDEGEGPARKFEIMGLERSGNIEPPGILCRF